MKKRLLPLLAMQILIFLVISVFAKQKELVIVNNGFYRGSYADLVNNYANDIINIEHKNVEVIPWIIDEGTNVEQCTAVLQRLQDEYVEARNEGDVLEGAVLIGDIPVPQYWGGYKYMPMDQVYMDIVNGSGNRYEPPTAPNYTPFAIAGDYYDTLMYSKYNRTIGDGYYDIWISRINAAYMHGIREGMTLYDEYSTYTSYLNRVKARMNEPTSVPSRGFYMGMPQNHSGTAFDNFGFNMDSLHLTWLAEFTDGHNSSFNWMSQLLAGPRGCINYGAFDGTLFSTTGRNRRYCIYDQLPNVYVYASGVITKISSLPIGASDTLGWEWAGLYNHSCPTHTNFFSNDGASNYIKLNGEFIFGTLGPPWGSNPADTTYRRTGGYGGGYYLYYDAQTDPNPYQEGLGYRNKGAEWRWRVPTGGTGDYNIYLYYEAPDFPARNTANCDTVNMSLHVVNVNGSGLPIGIVYDTTCRIDQQTHILHRLDDFRWESLFGERDIHLGLNQMAIVSMQLNDDANLHPGNRIVDAVRFFRTTPGVDRIVDDTMPGSITDVIDDPSGIFSTTGFHSLDDVFRGYEDLGSEPGGGGFSKTQFFMSTACSLNDFTYIGGSTFDKNIGNLYALGYNGLISFGSSETVGGGDNKTSFTLALRNGYCFGQSFLAQSNSNFFHSYALLGAGTLRAQPYVQFGSMVLEGFHVGNPRTDTTDKPVLIRNVTASSNWVVTSTHRSSSPFGTHGEIVVRPETSLSPTGSNEIRLSAY
jgi:hypothetical protein